MQKLFPLLGGQQPAGLYRLTSAAKAQSILATVQHSGWQPAYLAGEQIASKAALLRACAVAFRFPAYFGHNWDALEECLRDLSWLPAPGYLLLYDHASTLARQQPKEWATALNIFHEAVAHWHTVNIPFVVLLRQAGRYAATVKKL